MSRVVQISILGKVYGNVNADEVIGSRVTLKKMYSSSGEVLPFISARAIKFSIRQALRDMGLDVDPFIENPKAEETLRLRDAGDPHKYADNDLFGYMVAEKRREAARRRQAPVALSYFKALRDTPIKAEFAARFPRPWGERKEENPVPFEVEIAEFIGKLNCIMYDYIGKFEDREPLDDEERKRRIKAFTEILLGPRYVLPRRTNSLNIPEYISALIVLSEQGPLPVYQYLDYDFENNVTNVQCLKKMVEREEISKHAREIMFINYREKDIELPQGISKVSVGQAVEKIVGFL